MDQSRLVQLRRSTQGLINSPGSTVQEIVHWLGAVQSQEFTDAKWSIAQRMPTGFTEDEFTQAFNEGAIVRTHVLRPTWHFVAPADLRWMLALTAPRIKSFMKTNDRKLGMDDALYSRTNALIQQALQDGQHLTRAELADVLRQNGIRVVATALAHVMIRAEIDGVVCSGALRGRQHTYALLEHRAPQARLLLRDEALAELASRYFRSHGPATVQDFSWWSGLTLTDARSGLESIRSQLASERIDDKLASERIDDKTYWYVPATAGSRSSNTVQLLPNFDEYVVGYADRSTLFEPTYEGPLRVQGQILNHRSLVINGLVAGTWSVVRGKSASKVTLHPFRILTESEQVLIDQAIDQYATFYGLPVNNLIAA
ncbi:winged helix DNA-binding domain-containing protein [Spirosoma fluminis]